LWPLWPSLERFRSEIDDLFERFFGRSDRAAWGWSQWSGVETHFDNDKWIVRCDLPGVDPKNIDVSTVGNTLTIKATRERRSTESKDGEQVSYGRFEHTLTLPRGVNAEQIKANYQHGVLELTMPLAPEAAARRIPVTDHAPAQVEHKAA
jgi:HSP20 family protein